MSARRCAQDGAFRQQRRALQKSTAERRPHGRHESSACIHREHTAHAVSDMAHPEHLPEFGDLARWREIPKIVSKGCDTTSLAKEQPVLLTSKWPMRNRGPQDDVRAMRRDSRRAAY